MTMIPPKPDSVSFTDTQWRAIFDEGKNLLVSASAGSGKTTVLVERVIEKIKAGTNVDALLVVTFTNAAAKEMKDRIQAAVQKAITTETDVAKKRHLIAQLPLLPHASISTLHSFCLQIIRRYYYLVDFDPVFRSLADDTEVLLLKEDAWDEVREELYGQENDSFYRLADSFSTNRSDKDLTELVYTLADFAVAHPDPTKWLEHLAPLYESSHEDFLGSSLYVYFLKPLLLDMTETLKNLMEDALTIAEGEGIQRYVDLVQNEWEHYNKIQEYLLMDQFEAIYPLVQSFKFDTWPSKNKTMDEDAVASAPQMKVFRDAGKEIYRKKIKEDYFKAPLEAHLQYMRDSKELVNQMGEVTALFLDSYNNVKRSRKLIDFNDYHHLALAILKAENEFGRKEAMVHYQQTFDEVMIDEYQDINPLQEEILRCLSKPTTEPGNRFMVGDVKQSVYAFRMANPKLFIEKYERYKEGIEGERIILAENFRSRKEILDFTNFLFIQLMDKGVGQLAYDDAAELQLGFDGFMGTANYAPEILIYEKKMPAETMTVDEDDEGSGDDDFSIDGTLEGQFSLVASKIKELIDSKFELYDKKTKKVRPITYKDIVILTRTKNNNLVTQELFQQLDIPLAITETQNYFQTTEISIMMSLLKVIDNPYQDIPLAAVLRSPIVELDEQELALIRLADKEAPFYDALIQFHTTYTDPEAYAQASSAKQNVYKKTTVFLTLLQTWREKARRNRLVELIWSIYHDTGYLDYVGGMVAGKQRKANLHALYERAEDYEQTAFKGLFQFIRFIEKMQENDKDLSEPSPLSEGENAIRMMTIHKSKGLEFPVVFVVELSKQLSVKDLNKSYVLDSQYGVGIKHKDLDTRIVHETFPERVLKEEKKNQLRSEELRLLYVALTRAEQKIYLVGSYDNEEKAWEKWAEQAMHDTLVLPNRSRLDARSMMDWIGMALIRHPRSAYTSGPVTHIPELAKRDVPFEIHFYSEDDVLARLSTFESEEKSTWYQTFKQSLTSSRDTTDLSTNAYRAIELMTQTYGHQTATQTTSYQSVSEIKRLFEEPQDGRQSFVDVQAPRKQFRYVEEELAKPSFISELKEPTGTDIGQATHLLLQTLDLSVPVTELLIQQKILELQGKGIFSPQVAKKIPTDKLLAFFDTEFGTFIHEQANQLKREVPFALLMDAKDLYTDMNDEAEDHILVHGIIDGYIETETELILFDYKTDQVARFGQDAGAKMKEKYAGQLRLYKRALESILNKQVTHAYLILLDTTELVEIE